MSNLIKSSPFFILISFFAASSFAKNLCFPAGWVQVEGSDARFGATADLASATAEENIEATLTSACTKHGALPYAFLDSPEFSRKLVTELKAESEQVWPAAESP